MEAGKAVRGSKMYQVCHSSFLADVIVSLEEPEQGVHRMGKAQASTSALRQARVI